MEAIVATQINTCSPNLSDPLLEEAASLFLENRYDYLWGESVYPVGVGVLETRFCDSSTI